MSSTAEKCWSRHGTVMPTSYSSFTSISRTHSSRKSRTPTQPMEQRKLGFGSHDAHKTDEFTNVIRTETYRYQLKQGTSTSTKHRKVSANMPCCPSFSKLTKTHLSLHFKNKEARKSRLPRSKHQRYTKPCTRKMTTCLVQID